MLLKRNNLEGKQIGKWSVGEAVSKKGRLYYHCTCECGNERDVSSSVLNTRKSLGCIKCSKTGKVEDLTEKEVGNLYIKKMVIKDNRTYWLCDCKCGKKDVLISQHQIHDGKVTSCGCRMQVGDKIKDSLQKHYVDGTYIPAIINKKLNKNNSSGCKGVSFRPDRGKWRAYIKVNRQDIHLGNFDTYEDACMARKIAEEKYFGKILEDNNIDTKGREHKENV